MNAEMSPRLARNLYKAVREFKRLHPGVLEAETARRNAMKGVCTIEQIQHEEDGHDCVCTQA